MKHTNIFDNLDVEKITLYRPKINLDPENFQSLYYKTQKKNIFINNLILSQKKYQLYQVNN